MNLNKVLLSGITLQLAYSIYNDILNIISINKYLDKLRNFLPIDIKNIKDSIKNIKNGFYNKYEIFNLKKKNDKEIILTIPVRGHIRSNRTFQSQFKKINKDFIYIKKNYNLLNSYYYKKSFSGKMNIEFCPKLYLIDISDSNLQTNSINLDNIITFYINNFKHVKFIKNYEYFKDTYYELNKFEKAYNLLLNFFKVILYDVNLFDIFDIVTGHRNSEEGIIDNQLIYLIGRFQINLKTNEVKLKNIIEWFNDNNFKNYIYEQECKIYYSIFHIIWKVLVVVLLFKFCRITIKNINSSKGYIKDNLKCYNCNKTSEYMFDKCKHFIFCKDCLYKIKGRNCPVCGVIILKKNKIFIN